MYSVTLTSKFAWIARSDRFMSNVPWEDYSQFHLASLRAKKRGDSVFLIGLLNPASRYKKQIEDAEEIAALNLAKYRKAQQELEEAEDRSRQAEGQLGAVRSLRGSSIF